MLEIASAAKIGDASFFFKWDNVAVRTHETRLLAVERRSLKSADSQRLSAGMTKREEQMPSAGER